MWRLRLTGAVGYTRIVNEHVFASTAWRESARGDCSVGGAHSAAVAARDDQ
jgi:hypothetical protein